MTFWQFLNDNLFWLIIGIAVFGTGFGEGLRKTLDGRRKAALAVARAKAAERETKRLERLLGMSMDKRELTAGSDKDLLTRATAAINDRYEALGLLRDVQASNNAFPQLPQDLVDDIDSLIDRTKFRTRGETP